MSEIPNELLWVEPILGSTLTNVTRLAGGGNNRLFKLTTAQGRSYVLKLYFSNPADPRDRLGAEWGALSFLWNLGMRVIPEPVHADRSRNAMLFGFIEGKKKSGDEISKEDIAQVIEFIRALKGASQSPGVKNLPDASEASYSLEDLQDNVQRRFERVVKLRPDENPAGPQLELFVNERLIPYFYEQTRRATERLASQGITPSSALGLAERVLSPSDLGFHNAILNPQGTWIFHDFEYFGWDDPSKLIADFMLHPGMGLNSRLRRLFAASLLPVFADDSGLLSRFQSYYPLFAMKWCVILLNEFVPEIRARRQFALGLTPEQLRERQRMQLEKAATILEKVDDDFRECALFR